MMSVRKTVYALLLVFLISSCTQMSEITLERKIERVEKGLLTDQSDPPWKRMDLTDRMAHYKVPGVSIAMINDFKIEWAQGYGVLEAGKAQAVTTETIFQPGSTAKPIVAMAALYFVEAGDLELDSDVNNKLVSWKIPENELTAQAPVTLRRLLSHSAGIPYVPLHGYAQGQAIPNRQQLLDGDPPANSEPVRVVIVPGTLFSYSNGGYMVVEQLLVDAAGFPFDVSMQEIVFEPLHIDTITVKSPLLEKLAPVAASGHRVDGNVIPGGWHINPEMGTGGSWWASPSDMARLYINLMLTYNGQSENIISQEMAVEMLTPQIEDRGLGPWIGDEGGDLFYFSHPGHTDGYKTYIVCYPKRGQGVVIMTNSDAGDKLYYEILHSINNEYGWVRDYTFLYTVIAAIVFIGVVVFLMQRRKRSGSIQA
ncbi:MAG: beta-lactamase family protein [Anaerolineales bacterium]|nr:beta-lactamase family protein [Anaerolineales bacterium]